MLCYVAYYILLYIFFTERTYKNAPQKPPSSVDIEGINPDTICVTWRYVAPSIEEEPIKGYKVCLNA